MDIIIPTQAFTVTLALTINLKVAKFRTSNAKRQ